MKPVFLHTSDIHLNMKFNNKRFSLKEREKRREELWDTFDSIIRTANSEKIPYLFISGDLIQERYCNFRDLKRIKNKFESIKDTQIIIVCGADDSYSMNSIYEYVEWPSNVHMVKNTESIEKIEYIQDNLCIYAMSIGEKTNNIKSQVIYDLDVDDEKINVLLLYCNIEGSKDDKFYIDVNLIKNKFDYCALGFKHNYKKAEENVIYPGSPEPLDFTELNDHGVIKGILEKDNVKSSFLPLGKRKFIVRNINIELDYDFNKILDLIKFSGDTFSNIKDYVRVNITGNVNTDISMDDIKEEAKQFFYYIEFEESYSYKNDSDKKYDVNEGTIMESYKLQFENLEGKDKRIYQQAFELGIEALRKEKVVR